MSIYIIADKLKAGSKFNYRVTLAPTTIGGNWVVIYHHAPLNDLTVLDKDVTIKTLQAVIQKVNISNTQASVDFLDVYDTLFERRRVIEYSVIGKSKDTNIFSIQKSKTTEHSEPVKFLKQQIKTLYENDLFLQEFQERYKNTFSKEFLTEKSLLTEPSPIFTPNGLMFIEILQEGKWIPVFGGIIKSINTALSKMGKAVRSVTVKAVHPFEYLSTLDFVQSFYSGMLMFDIFRQRSKEVIGFDALNDLEWKLYLALWVGQYDKKFREAISDNFRGTEALQYFSLLEIFRFLSHIGNLRLFAKKLNTSDVKEGMPLSLGKDKDIEQIVEIYNQLVTQFSPFKYFIDKGWGIFAEYQKIEDYVIPNDVQDTAEYFLEKVGIKENEFKIEDRFIPFRYYLDSDIAKCSSKDKIDCTDFVKYLYKGVLSVSFSYFIESKNKARVKNLLTEITSATMLEFFNLPNGSQFVSYPAFYKKFNKSGVIVTLKEVSGGNASFTHNWDTDNIITMATTFAGQDYINITENVVRKALYWGVYIDPISTVKYGMKEITAPTIYTPIWKVDEQYRNLIRNFLRSYQTVVNSKNFSNTITLNYLLLPDLLYRVGQPAFVSGIDWIYSVSSYELSIIPASSVMTKLNLTQGVPLSMYDELHSKEEEPTWKIIRNILSKAIRDAYTKMEQNDTKSLNTPVSGVFRKGKPKPFIPKVETLSKDDVKVLKNLSGGKLFVFGGDTPTPSPESGGVTQAGIIPFTKTVQNTTSVSATSPDKQRFRFQIVVPEVENAIEYTMSGIKTMLNNTGLNFSKFEILKDVELYHRNKHPVGITIKGIRVHKPVLYRTYFTQGTSSKLEGNYWDDIQVEALNKDLIFNIKGEDKDQPLFGNVKIHWDDITYSIASHIYTNLLSRLDLKKPRVYFAYHNVLGAFPISADFEPPWSRTESAVWVMHACERFVHDYLKDLVDLDEAFKYGTLSRLKNPFIIAKYGNVVTVLPSNVYHWNDIFILMTSDIPKIYNLSMG